MSANSPSPCGMWTIPRSAITSACSPSIRCPSNQTSPANGFISPLTARSRVDFPCPFGPMITTHRPGCDPEREIADDHGVPVPGREPPDVEDRSDVAHPSLLLRWPEPR